jgi:hypothetical protein
VSDRVAVKQNRAIAVGNQESDNRNTRSQRRDRYGFPIPAL